MNSIKSRNRNYCFTLAEILITLGIVGIISAITIPSLLRKFQEKVTINRLNHVYANLQQAFKLAIDDYGTLDMWCKKNQDLSDFENAQNCASKTSDILTQYIKGIQKCNNDLHYTNTCLAPVYKWRDGETIDYLLVTWYNFHFIMLNGISVTIHRGGECSIDKSFSDQKASEMKVPYGTYLYSQNCGTIWVDLNGKSGPNKDGEDLFGFLLFRDGIKGLGQNGIHSILSFDNCVTNKHNIPGACTAWLLENKNMDYLHCPEKLGWNKARSCKE